MADGSRRKIAIACQGGGSHTAFTAGVLDRLLDETDRFDLVGLSGTSGGAMCALLAWYGYLHDEHDPGELLLDFWADLAAHTPFDRAANDLMRTATRLRLLGVAFPEMSPYWTPASAWGQWQLRRLLTDHVDFEHIPDLLDETTDPPALLISAVEVLTGEFTLFRETDIAPEVILASAAEPNLFEAVAVGDRMYWDGLFSKNPPVGDFNVEHDIPDPDEIWVIRINPEERLRVPKSLNGIMDRRNELAGNLSINAEIHFMRRVNQWVDRGYLPDRYTHTDIRSIRFKRQLDWTTKTDRSPEFLQSLIRDGRHRADEFIETQL